MQNLLLFVLLLSSYSTMAQTVTVSGNVSDEDNQPLEYANVLLMNAADSTLYKGVISETGGQYLIQDVEKGLYFVEASMVGLGKAHSEVFNLEGSDINVPSLSLSNGIEIDEVLVTAKKPFIELKADKMIVNVANSSVNAGNSALEVLEKSPGVAVDNNNNISLRGKQGVLVMINGKNQYMSGDEIARLLENMPSSNIQNIEIITNPSAKYDAEGNSGIINIVLKKNEKVGSNGSVSTTFRQGRKTSHFHNLNLNYRSEKINVYGQGEYYNWGWEQDLGLKRDIAYNGGNTIFDQNSLMEEVGDGYNVKLGMDYNLSDRTTLGLMVKRNQGDEQDGNENVTQITGDNMPGFSRLVVSLNDNEDYLTNTANANLNHKFNDKGLELTLDADISNYSNDQLSNYDNFYRNNNNDEVATPYYLKNNQLTDIKIFASTADLTIPVSEKTNLETGVKLSMVDTEANTMFESLQDGIWQDEVQRSNDFMYQEDVYAAYINGSTSIGKTMIQAGLRTEHTSSRGISATVGTDIPRSYTDFFPSVSISRQIGEQHNVSVSYSRRLERPNYRNLNPFEDYLDQYTFNRGNPLLNPQYSDALNLNYAMGNALYVSLGYSKTHDAISEILEQNSETNTTFQTNDNIDKASTANLVISMPKVWTEWWTTRFNYTGFYNEFKSVLANGELLDNNSFGNHFNVNNEIQLGKGINMEVSGWYQTKAVFGQLTINPRGSLDIGFSTRVFDKLRVKVGVSDVFQTRNNLVSIDQGGVNILVDQVNDTRRVTLNLAYNFGNQKVKRARDRKTSSSDESNRI